MKAFNLKLWGVLLFVLMIGYSSCTKKWVCRVPAGWLVFVKGNDTVSVNTSVSNAGLYDYSQSFVDSLKEYYRMQGYTSTGVYPEYFNTEYLYNNHDVQAYQNNGVQCAIDNN